MVEPLDLAGLQAPTRKGKVNKDQPTLPLPHIQSILPIPPPQPIPPIQPPTLPPSLPIQPIMAEEQLGLEEVPRLQSGQLAILEELLNLEVQDGPTAEKVKAFQADAASIVLLLRTSVTSMAKAYNEARRFESEGKVSRIRGQLRKMEKFGEDLEEVKNS